MATEKFQSAGADTWTCPANVYKVKAECWGGGGNGVNSSGSGGGGGGGYSQLTAHPVNPGTTYNLTVGGVAGDTNFDDAGTCLAKGGASGSGSSGGAGGAAGSGVGDIKYSGGDGGGSAANGGGGGGAAGPDGNGNAGAFNSTVS